MRRKANTLFAGFHWTVQITKRLNKPPGLPTFSIHLCFSSQWLYCPLTTPLWGIQAWNIKSQTIKYNNKEKANDEMEFNMLGLLQPYKAKDNCLKIYSHVYFFLKKNVFYFGLEGLNLQDRTLPAHRLRFCHCAALILSRSSKITCILQY